MIKYKYAFISFLVSFVLFLATNVYGINLMAIGDSRNGEFNEDFHKTKIIIDDAIGYMTSNYDTLDVIIMTGDYVNSGGNEDQWTDWRLANDAAFEYPIYPCIGNHDDEPKDRPWWLFVLDIIDYYSWNYYTIFDVERWYSVDVGNMVHITVIDSCLDGWGLNNLDGDIIEWIQYNWYLKDIIANEDKFNIIVFHEPAYGSHTWFGKGHGSNRFIRQRYIETIKDKEIELVLAGHNHWYERVFVNNVYHITTGGGGAPQLPVSPLPSDKVAGSQVNDSSHHYLVLEVDEDNQSVYIKAIKETTHEILDEFIIYKK